MKKYADMVYRLAFAQVRSKSDADDIFQEVFLRYVRKKLVFESEEHRKAWLIRVTVNCTKKHWSSAWHRRTVPLEDSYPFETNEETGVNEAVWKLAPKYRSVIHLFYYEGYSVAEISSILDVRESTVRTQLTRARAKLSEMLKGDL
ncbi:RNA polymerase sigma factor [Ruminiclostridium sufflavum]|uniref:RNA polymerase sigma factor n=1 Tax=Ruminiclostridium sufflavum TaxID=396504 RepID=UPI0030ED823B